MSPKHGDAVVRSHSRPLVEFASPGRLCVVGGPSLPPMGEVWSEGEELAEVEQRKQEIAGGQVQPLSDTEFGKRVEAGRQR